MASYILHLLVFLIVVPSSITALWPPSPGYFPSSKFRTLSVYQAFTTLWGPQHQKVDNKALTVWLDKSSGSGFKSIKPFRSGYFAANIKLQPGYTAGIITTLYLSNQEAHVGQHDEIDIEFLGTTIGKPYTLQTNVYINGTGDKKENHVGREMQYHLWFDPTENFHHYAILWNPKEIIFLVDDVPIRRYPRVSDATFPRRPMWVYGSIWDASDWATEGGKYRADYRYEPFVGKFANFKASGCTAFSPPWCRPVTASPYHSGGLTERQNMAMKWVQENHLVYNYCADHGRERTLTPEC